MPWPTRWNRSAQVPDARRLRTALTYAEDGLREIASPSCGIYEASDGITSYDTTAATRVAEGTLARIREALGDE